jgi:hypothetical protein
MTTRDNTEVHLRVHGFLEATPHCDGFHLSTERGLDRPCCAKCHNFRIIFYRGNGRVLTNKKIFEYLEYLKKMDIEDFDSSYAIATCGPEKVLCFTFGRTELYTDTFYTILLKQFITLHKSGIILQEINAKTFAYTKSGIPIIFPVYYTEHKNYGDDEGVKILETINGRYIKEIDREKRTKSAKWTFLFQFFEALDFFKPISGEYYENPEYYINEELFLKIPDECKNEGI